MKFVITIILFFITAYSFASEHYVSILEQANSSYKAEKYEEALVLYQQILAADYESASLYYNLGNTHYKLNQIPSALLNYEKALKLDPENTEIRYNISLANQQITDEVNAIPPLFFKQWWVEFKNLFSIDNWAWNTIILLFMSVISFILFRLSKTETIKKISFYLSLFLFFSSFIGYISAYQQKKNTETNTEAIVFTPSLTVKSSPANNSTNLFVIHEGTKVKLIETNDSWYKISIADGNTGWVKKETVEPI